jgi:hypothetical protein
LARALIVHRQPAGHKAFLGAGVGNGFPHSCQGDLPAACLDVLAIASMCRCLNARHQ